MRNKINVLLLRSLSLRLLNVLVVYGSQLQQPLLCCCFAGVGVELGVGGMVEGERVGGEYLST